MRLAGHHLPRQSLGLFAMEAAVIAFAARVAWPGAHGGVAAVVIGAVVVQFALYWADLYDVRVAEGDAASGRRLLSTLGITALVAAPILYAVPQGHALARVLAATAVATAAVRAVAPWRTLRRRVFLLGSGEALRLLRTELVSGAELIVGTADPRDGERAASAATTAGAEVVVVACDERRGMPQAGLLRARLQGIEVLDAVTYLERTRRKVPVGLLRPATLIYDQGFERSRWSDAARRALSMLVAIILAVALSPVALLIAVAIRLDSDGPIFYRQRRVGRGGREFWMWKFRTMRVDAEAQGATWAAKEDPRVTRVGALIRRARLDELPQLLNVLAGHMDVVGPRPERPEFVADLEKELPFYDLRALVRPGITGWAQIRFHYGASVEDAREKLGFDLYYVKNASLVLDLIILFHTAKVVATGRGAR